MPARPSDESPQAAPAELGRRVVTGARFVALNRVVQMVATWVTTVALARFLDPSEYGLAGMALVVFAILTVFQDSGLHAALIQRRDRIQEAVDTATAYTPILGVAVLLLCFALAPLAGVFFHRHEVTDLVRALGFVFLLRAFSQVPAAVLQKELMFGRFAAVTISGTIVQSGIVIGLAAGGAGAWSVIIGQLVLAGWQALLLWPLCPMRPHPRRASLTVLRELLGYGRHMVGTNVSNFASAYVDVAVVGRMLGSAAVGAYTLGFQTGRQAVASVTYVSNLVIFPAFSKLQDDLDRFRRAYLRSLRFVSVISVPAGLGLAAVSQQFVDVVYGTRWSAAGPVVAIIALMGIVVSITAPMGEVLKAAGRPSLFFRLSLLQTALVAVGVIAVYRFGIAAVAGAQAGGVTVTGLVLGRSISRILDIDPREWVSTLLPSVVPGVVMGAGILVTKLAASHYVDTARPGPLLLLIVEGAVIYLAIMRLTYRERYHEFIAELARLVGVSKVRRLLPTPAKLFGNSS